MFFFGIKEENTLKIDEFSDKFINNDGYSTTQEAEELLAVMLKSFKIYRNKKPADPENTKQLAKILSQIYHKANVKEVRANV